MTQQTNGTPELNYSEEVFRDMYEALRQFERMGFFKESSTYLRGLRNIIAKAEGRD